MDEGFLKAAKVYFGIVEEACNLLMDEIGKRKQAVIRNKYDLYEYLYLQGNRIFEVVFDDRKYYFHGVGCTVFMNGVPMINWDFGCRSWWCGIDPFKMATTLKCFSFEETEYYDGNYIKNKCELYLSEKALYFYKGQYYIDLLRLGCKKIEFPMDYERMIVEYKGVSRSYLKCKSIDRFIQKSTKVYEGIDDLKNNYTLVFYHHDSVVARIPYNDIAYPDAAVKIMNGEIIKPHRVEIWKQ